MVSYASRAAGNRESRSEPKLLPPARSVSVLSKHYDLALHAQLIVQGADVGIDAGMSEGDAEPCDAERRLPQPDFVLRCGADETGIHSLGDGVDDSKASAIGIANSFEAQRV